MSAAAAEPPVTTTSVFTRAISGAAPAQRAQPDEGASSGDTDLGPNDR